MNETREIGGRTVAGTPEQLDLVEEYEILLKGQRVTFPTERGERIGRVIEHSLSGGGNLPWTLWVTVEYRKGRYPVKAADVQLAA